MLMCLQKVKSITSKSKYSIATLKNSDSLFPLFPKFNAGRTAIRGKRKMRVNKTVDSLRGLLGPLGWGVLVLFIGSRVNDVSLLVYNFYLGRTLDSDSFGALAPSLAFLTFILMPVVGYLQVVMKSLSRLKALKKEREYKGLLSETVLLMTVGYLFLSLVIWFSRFYILERLHLEGSLYVVIFILLFTGLWWYSICPVFFQSEQKFGWYSLYIILSAAAMLISTFVFVGGLGLGLKGALLGRVASNIFLLFVVVLVLRKTRGAKAICPVERGIMNRMLLPYYIYMGTLFLLTQAAYLFVRNFAVTESVGLGPVASLGMIPCYIITGFVTVLFPLAAAGHASGVDIRKYYSMMLWGGIIVTVCTVVGFFLFGERLLAMWNEEFVLYTRSVLIFAAAMGLNGTIQTIATVEMARDRYRFLWFLVVPALLMCGVLYIRRVTLSIEEAMVSVLFTHILVLFLLLLHIRLSDKRPSPGTALPFAA